MTGNTNNMTINKLQFVHEPGRIDTLTEDQEQKLKDMWAQILIFTGDIPHSIETSPSTLAVHEEDDKKKKKKRGFLGLRKSKEHDGHEKTSAEATSFKDSLEGIEPEKLTSLMFSMVKGDHPDNLLLRFLRARKWVVKDALEMLGCTIAWRHQNNVDDILSSGEKAVFENNDEEFKLQLRAKKSYIWGYDFKGQPIVHVKTYNHDPKAQGEESMEKFTIYIIETVRLCLKDPVDTAAVFFDLSNFSMSNMDYSPVKFMIKCFERHYPECLGFLLIHNAPWMFTGIWNIIKGWIDPVVASKIKFTKTTEDVAKYIPMEWVEKNLGGTNENSYEFIEPVPGENDLMNDTAAIAQYKAEHDKLVKEFLDSTVAWVNSDAKTLNGQEQASKNNIAKELRKNFLASDPYVRSRGIFDRNGCIGDFRKMHSDPNWK